MGRPAQLLVYSGSRMDVVSAGTETGTVLCPIRAYAYCRFVRIQMLVAVAHQGGLFYVQGTCAHSPSLKALGSKEPRALYGQVTAICQQYVLRVYPRGLKPETGICCERQAQKNECCLHVRQANSGPGLVW